MSFFYLGKSKDNRYEILDTDDLKTDYFTESELNKVKQMGITIKKFTIENAHIGLECRDNKYSIYLDGYPNPLYTGEFPISCRRNDIIGFDIRLKSVGIFKGYIYFAVVCNCWCKYDVEVPMIMCHLISTDTQNVSCTSSTACYTREPVYLSTKSFYNLQRKQCFDDFPDFYVSQNDADIEITSKGLKVLGVVFKERPIYVELDEKLKQKCK